MKKKIASYAVYAELRDSAGMNDFAVSKETGIAPATLSEWKRLGASPKVDKLLKLAQLFGVPVDIFVIDRGVIHEYEC